MAEMPTGTVTFLFTDVEGSTRLWEQQPEAMRQALVRHDAIIEDAVGCHSGLLVRPRGEGDGRFAVFARPTDAVAATAAIQQALHAEPWPATTPLRVRLAVHTGEADRRDGDYYGSAVNRCARLRALAHGGQALLSQATYDLIRDAVPAGVALRDLGEQRLADLSRPERVFQVVQPTIGSVFPPLRSLDTLPNNLPLQLTNFVGREQELAEAKRCLEQTRLLTLTGTGGCGKTRLALQVAAELLERYPDGVWLVELATLADPTLVASSVAAVLAIPDQPGQPLEQTLAQALHTRRLLLLLDNCEHLLDACSRLADLLLRGCPGLTILATSREALGIAGETSRRVPSLGLPPPDGPRASQQIQHYEAVLFFSERARLVQPNFVVTDQNAAAVVHVCRRLDGIPLALELAAARLRVLSIEQLAARLDRRFRLLTGGSRTALPRQQTLRAAIDWSYDLLEEPERRLFQRLAVFAGDWTLDAAEALGSGQGIEQDEVLDLLARLVDKSLVVTEEQPEATTRYRLLETLRQYGREQLSASGEAEGQYDRHAAYYCALAAAAAPELQGVRQIEALDQQEADEGNLRQALEWLIGRGDGEGAVRLATDRFWYLIFRSRLFEGREGLQRALAAPGAKPATRAIGLARLSMLSWILGAGPVERAPARRYAEEAFALAANTSDQAVEAVTRFSLGFTSSDDEERLQRYAEALERYRALNDRVNVAYVIQQCAIVVNSSRDEPAVDRFLEEGDRLWHELGQPWGLGQHLWLLGRRALRRGDLSAARAHLEESLRLHQAVGYRWGIGGVLESLGQVAYAQGHVTTARDLLERALTEYREVGVLASLPYPLADLAEVLLEQGEQAAAGRLLADALRFAATQQLESGTARALEALTGAEVLQGQPEQALRFAGAAMAWRGQTGAGWSSPFQQQRFERRLAQARAAVGDGAAEAAITAGRQLTLAQAAEVALRELARGTPR